jgi:hypothetical protein
LPYEPYVSKKRPRDPAKIYCETCERPYERHFPGWEHVDYGPYCAAWVSEIAVSAAYGSFYDGGTGEFLEGQKPRTLALGLCCDECLYLHQEFLTWQYGSQA